MLRSVVRTIAAGSVAAAIIACGGSSDGGTTGPTSVFTSVSVLPATPSVSVGSTTTLTATAKDQNGANFAGAPAATWTSSNTAAATVDASGVVTGVSNGNATITASITAGSVTHTGMQPVSVSTPSATGNVQATTTLAFDPSNLTVARSSGTASVTWHFQTVQHTVTWDATAGAEDDIPATASANIARNFTVAGTYHYHCAIHPSMTGVVTVQ